MSHCPQRADTNRSITALRARRWLAAAATMLALTGCDPPPPPAAEPAAPPVETTGRQIDLQGPTILAFLPPEAERPDVEGAPEALGHVRFAMSDTAQCIGYAKNVQMTTVFAEQVTIRDGDNRQTIELGKLGQGIGAVLAEPGRTPKVVHTEVGASSLQHLLPQAVFEYWQLADCKRE